MRIGTALVAVALASACGDRAPDADRTARQEAEVRVEAELALRRAYDLSMPDVADRMLALYPDSGRIVSATGGTVITSRDSLASGIQYFWNNVGTNMRDPRWVWDEIFVDVLSPTSAAVTATYHIPHRNPRNEPHVLGGAMTVIMTKRKGRWVVIQEHLSDLPQVTDSLASGESDDDQ